MASDHRGRLIHAGKRTAQEMEERNWWGATTEIPKGELVDGPDRPGMIRSSTWGGTTFDLGRGKFGVIHSTNSPDGDILQVHGSTRTYYRSTIARRAMQKRMDEGRDLKTGRPTKSGDIDIYHHLPKE